MNSLFTLLSILMLWCQLLDWLKLDPHSSSLPNSEMLNKSSIGLRLYNILGDIIVMKSYACTRGYRVLSHYSIIPFGVRYQAKTDRRSATSLTQFKTRIRSLDLSDILNGCSGCYLCNS